MLSGEEKRRGEESDEERGEEWSVSGEDYNCVFFYS